MKERVEIVGQDLPYNSLENNINIFLEETAGTLTDIKFSICMDEDVGEIHYKALIIYIPKKEK